MNLIVTAGPTREPLDPVRFLSNRSSGKMGYALARVAMQRGHAVALISGPVALTPPSGAQVIPVVTAAEMLAAIRRQWAWCDALIMAAAVCDWRPACPALQKIKKARAPLSLQLEQTPDILSTLLPAKGRRIMVGFAAETERVTPEARRKLREKGLDLIVANNVGQPDAGFEVDTNRVTLISVAGQEETLPLMTKDAVAARVVQWVEQRRKILG